MTITLIRNHNSPSFRKGTEEGSKAVHGTITLPFDTNKPLVYPTLENADYLIPEGTYPLKKTWSPKFKKILPLIDNVPGRDGIRFHRGTQPEHSQGCILVSDAALQNLSVFIDKCKYHDYEKLFIQIRND